MCIVAEAPDCGAALAPRGPSALRSRLRSRSEGRGMLEFFPREDAEPEATALPLTEDMMIYPVFRGEDNA